MIADGQKSPYTIEENEFCQYSFFEERDKESIYEAIRKKEVDTIFVIG